jgi:hypothetical protein
MGPDTEYALISLTHGKVAVIDLLDCAIADMRKWHAEKPTHRNRQWRASGVYRGEDGKQHKIWLHRAIHSAPSVDHKSCDGLDNRRRNLRSASANEQQWNRPATKRNKFGAKGVHLDRRRNRYCAKIRKFGRSYFLGEFRTLDEAAAAYRNAALQMHGYFANLGGVPSETR